MYSAFDGHVRCLQVCTIVSNATVNIFIPIFQWAHESFPLFLFPEVYSKL